MDYRLTPNYKVSFVHIKIMNIVVIIQWQRTIACKIEHNE